MPPAGHKAITVTHETWGLIEELRRSLPLKVSQGEVVRAAILVLYDQPDILDAIVKAQRGPRGKGK